jgi:hypothetical protein
LWLAGPAAAQFSLSRDGSRGVAASQVAQREDVQKELGLSADQVRRLKELSDRTRKQREDEFVALSQLDPKARDQKRQELVKKISKEEGEALKTILEPKQMRRLKELTFQLAYVQAFGNEEVEKALGLSEEQRSKIKAVMRGTIADMRQLFQETREGVGEGQAKAAQLRDRAYEQSVAVLTPEQRKKWVDIQGQPFAFAMPERAKPNLNASRTKDVPEGARPSKDPKDLRWVKQRVEDWQPTEAERKVDLIGWADGLVPAVRLAREHKRPVFIFTLDGELGKGRC